MESKKDKQIECVDMLGCQNDPDYLKYFLRCKLPLSSLFKAAELVVLSTKVTKSSGFWGSTDVHLVITKENIYHFEKKSSLSFNPLELKHHRLVEKMLGFTKSSVKGKQ